MLPGMTAKPSVSLVAVAGRRRATLDLARRLEDEGFGGIYCPSPGDGLALCEALALTMRALPFGTSIANIYTRHAFDYAQTAAVIHELSGGRFRFGLGVSHGPMHQRLGLRVGKPLEDVRKFVADVRAAAPQVGTLPPLVLATLRRRMVELAGENPDDAVRAAMSDCWLSDVTLFGPAKDVRDGVEAWRAAGVRTVILVPSSTRGGQLQAFEELMAAFR